jgi:hydrogenase nickel incorporation protein HypA/HybF
MQEVCRQALAAAAAEGAVSIAVVRLRVGELAGVELEALRFAFPLVMQDTIAALAQLQIESVPAICYCAACDKSFHAQQGHAVCPSCGTLSKRLLSGQELQLVAVEVD